MKPASTLRFFPLASAIAALLAGSHAQSAELYWDADAATPGAGGTALNGIWSAPGTFWSTDRNGTVATPGTTTSLLDDLFFSSPPASMPPAPTPSPWTMPSPPKA